MVLIICQSISAAKWWKPVPAALSWIFGKRSWIGINQLLNKYSLARSKLHKSITRSDHFCQTFNLAKILVKLLSFMITLNAGDKFNVIILS